MSILKDHSKDFSESICTWYSSCSIIAAWFLTPDEHSMDLACSLTRVIFHCCLRYLSLLTLFVHVDNSYRYPKRLIWVLIKTKSFLCLDMIFSLCKAEDDTSLWRGGKSGGHPERGSRHISLCHLFWFWKIKHSSCARSQADCKQGGCSRVQPGDDSLVICISPNTEKLIRSFNCSLKDGILKSAWRACSKHFAASLLPSSRRNLSKNSLTFPLCTHWMDVLLKALIY